MVVSTAGISPEPHCVPARRLPQHHPDRRTADRPWPYHRDRRQESFHHRYHDSGRRHAAQRSQRPDGSFTSAPAVRGLMSASATQFTVPTVAEAVAAAIGDRELIIQGERRYSYAEIVERSNRLAAYLHSRGLGCHTERSALAGHEVGQDLHRPVRLQRKRIRRGAARCLRRARRPLQRQLPLRQERVAVSARGFGCDRADLPRRVRAAGSRSVAGPSAADEY